MFKIVRQGFVQPRKTVVNNLSGIIAKDDLIAVLREKGLSETVRPHELREEDWFGLVACISE